MGPLRASVDERRSIMTDVLERLYASDFRALRGLDDWLDRNPIKTFDDWLAILTTNIIKDRVRSKLGARHGTDDDGAAVNKRMVNTLASRLESKGVGPAVNPAMTDRQTAREIVEFARAHLSADQLTALEAWLRGATFEEIARELDLPAPREAERRVRAGLARLRRHVDE